MLLRLLLVVALLGWAAGEQAEPHPLFSTAPLPQQRCSDKVPVEGLNLTAAEQELLQYICWPVEDAEPEATLLEAEARGVPAGVNCTVVEWCAGRRLPPPLWLAGLVFLLLHQCLQRLV